MKLRYTDLDHEVATGLEVGCDVLEAGHLRILGDEVVDRVEDEVGERERALSARRREVPDGHGDPVSAGLCAQTRNHGAREVDAMHFHTPLRERQRDPPRPDTQLERGAVVGERSKEVDDRLDRRSLEHLVRWVVVAGRDLLTEVVFGHVAQSGAGARRLAYARVVRRSPAGFGSALFLFMAPGVVAGWCRGR